MVSGQSIQTFEPHTYTNIISVSNARSSRIPLSRFDIAVIVLRIYGGRSTLTKLTFSKMDSCRNSRERKSISQHKVGQVLRLAARAAYRLRFSTNSLALPAPGEQPWRLPADIRAPHSSRTST